MWVDDLKEFVSVGLVPEYLQIAVIIVPKKHMSLGDEVLVGVCLQCLVDPLNHFNCFFF